MKQDLCFKTERKRYAGENCS